MVEFALVLPIFLLLVMGIIDFGFLFYNYISMENASRNAARVACVEYKKIGYDVERDVPLTPRVLKLPDGDATLLESYTGDEYEDYRTNEIELCRHVARSLEHTGIDDEGRTVTVTYTYDESPHSESEGWEVKDRHQGDVIVKVEGKAHVLTPVLAVTADHMLKPLATSSVYKVERQYESN